MCGPHGLEECRQLVLRCPACPIRPPGRPCPGRRDRSRARCRAGASARPPRGRPRATGASASAGAAVVVALLNFASNSTRSLSASARAAAAAASSRVQSRWVGRLARPEKASGLSGCPRNSTISHSSVPSWLRNDSSSAGVAKPPLPLEITLYSQTAINCREGKTSQMTVGLPSLFLGNPPRWPHTGRLIWRPRN